jgi:PAS domain-containing protein
LKVICSYCHDVIDVREPLNDDRVSHGLCRECTVKFEKQCRGQNFGEYLDNFDFPVLIVDGDARVIAANHLMALMLGKSDREMFGLLGGEALECRYARLDGGCGKTVHCPTCTVRNLVEKTYQTGDSFFKVPAYVDQEGKRLEFYVSTAKLVRSVQVMVEPMPESGNTEDVGHMKS